MALGKKLFEFNQGDIVRGMSASDDLSDGGYSNLTEKANITKTPGVLYFPAPSTDASTAVADTIIASCEDNSATYERLFLGSGGKFYGWNGTTMAVVATDATRTFTRGITDMASYNLYTYGTSTTYVFEWNVAGASVNQTFFAFPSSSGSSTWTAAFVSHPCITYEGNIFYGNGPQLLRQTAVGGTPAEILLLENSGEVIVALGVDPGSGKMLISTTSRYNASDTVNTINRVYYYDGFSNKPLKVSIVDDLVTMFKTVGSLIYVGYGQNLGYWDGSGIQFLRRVAVSLDNNDLIYKHRVTNIGSTLYLIENTQILAHGPVYGGGGKVFYYAFKNDVNSNDFSHIANIGQNKLGLAYATSLFSTWDSSSIATISSTTFKTNVYDFPDEVWLERLRIIWKNTVASNQTYGYVRFVGEDGVITSVGGAGSGVFVLKNTTGAATAVYEVNNVNIKVKQVQVELFVESVNPGLMRIIGYGKIANE